MTMPEASEPETQLLRGTLHVLILKTLAGGAMHGYAVATRIAERTGGVLALEDGALYQALHRMQERGWLDSEWGQAATGKRARFYRLTSEGRRRLKLETESWMAYAEAVFKVLGPLRAEGA
jgi:transcriptional regulator